MATDGQVVSADGTRIGVRRVGAGQPVVLVHGSYGGLDSFQAVAEGLSDGFECWLMARRGHAPSDTPNQANTFAAEVHDVLAVLAAAHDQAGTGRRAHLVGGSYGATLALHTALTDPHALGALALFEPPLFAAGPGLVPVLSQYRALLAADDLTGASRLFAQQVARAPATLLAGSDDDDPPDGDPDVTSTGTRVPVDDRDPAGAAVRLRIARAALHDLEAMTTDSEDVTRWSAIGSPTLVIRWLRVLVAPSGDDGRARRHPVAGGTGGSGRAEPFRHGYRPRPGHAGAAPVPATLLLTGGGAA